MRTTNLKQETADRQRVLIRLIVLLTSTYVMSVFWEHDIVWWSFPFVTICLRWLDKILILSIHKINYQDSEVKTFKILMVTYFKIWPVRILSTNKEYSFIMEFSHGMQIWALFVGQATS